MWAGVETLGPAPFLQAAPRLPLDAPPAPEKPQQRERSLPSRSHSPRRLRSRQLKRHMQLLFPATAARNPSARHARARQ